jgi:hypothetical protein
MPQRKPKITARKYEGDDAQSWAVFVDGRVFVSGLGHRDVAYHKKVAAELIEKRRARDAAGIDTLDEQ